MSIWSEHQIPGDCYWLTGLSGAGKSTIGKQLYRLLRQEKDAVVLLDGDQMRAVFSKTTSYDMASRKELAYTYARLCKLLTDQGQDVVCATISMFQDVRDWNRAKIPNYREIYIEVSKQTLITRDQKQLYSRALAGEVKDVMGMDLEFQAPRNPDLVLANEGDQSPLQQAKIIFSQFHPSMSN